MKAGLGLISLCLACRLALGGANDAVTVEALGFASPGRQVSRAELRRQAIADALGNAVVQARSEVATEARVDGMRLVERRIHIRSLGFVESSKILQSGFVTSANGTVYRVRMEVVVKPGFPEGKALQSVPSLSLAMVSNLGKKHEKACRAALSSTLRACGLRVAENAEGSATVLPVKVEVSRSANGALWEIQWQMGIPSSDAPRETEYLMFSGTEADLLSELRQMGMRMAADALRLWFESAERKQNPEG